MIIVSLQLSGNVQGLRQSLADGLMVALVTVPVVATMRLNSLEINELVTWLAFAFSLTMLPEGVRELAALRRNKVAIVLAGGAALCMLSWEMYQGPFLAIPRFWLYVTIALFFVCASAWIRSRGEQGLRKVFFAKLAVTVLALALIAGAMLVRGDANRVTTQLPIYRHIRHLNYDLTVVIALSCYFWAISRSKSAALLFGALFVALGYFSAWSGGRGQMLALAVALVVLLGSRCLSFADRRLLLPLAMFAVGAVLVPVMGHGELLASQLGKVAAVSADTASSGRLSIWLRSIERLDESLIAVLFGFGPDTFVRHNIPQVIWPGHAQSINHPHNTVVQWLLEFGAVGTLALLTVYGAVALRAFQALYRGRTFGSVQAVAALLLGFFVYALTDGVFYHGIPLTMITLLCAYLHVARPSSAMEAPSQQSRCQSVPSGGYGAPSV